ncbi:class I SAM-dependent methyltransferase [Methylobacterium nigriterrae]|uniref:class I SAM-dependent methyltransferase n=1 Tax=Methylobacterium nigriterrae TaxID=3127512 RepID=UPI00301323A2
MLHVGCGIYAPEKLHPAFRDGSWREVRMDLDPRVKPDIVGSITDLSAFRDGTVEALWSSHNVEHLQDHEVPLALREFRRVLKGDGFALITTPDIESVAKLVVEGKLDATAYVSPAGPITALDMIFGHRASIQAGNHFMEHKTAFTAERLGRLLLEAGFPKVVMRRGTNFDLWAVALMPDAAPPEAYLGTVRQQ